MAKAIRNYRLQPRVIGARGELERRIIVINGRYYHVTKGWRELVKDKDK